MDFDASLASHPVVVDVDTPDQINAVFDIIAYSKGASVIRYFVNTAAIILWFDGTKMWGEITRYDYYTS